MIGAAILSWLKPIIEPLQKRFSKIYLDHPKLTIEIERENRPTFEITGLVEVINGIQVFTSMRSWSYLIKVFNHSEFPAIGLSFNTLTDDPNINLRPSLTINSRIDPGGTADFGIVFEKKVVQNEPLPDDFFKTQMEEYKRQKFILSYMNIHRIHFYTVHDEDLSEGSRDSFHRGKPQ
jgi:hypothetical protein